MYKKNTKHAKLITDLSRNQHDGENEDRDRIRDNVEDGILREMDMDDSQLAMEMELDIRVKMEIEMQM